MKSGNKLRFKEELMKLNNEEVRVSVPLGSVEFKELRPFFVKIVREGNKRGIKKNPFRTSS